jgi:sugar diacid utilization regulator/putative methionine-R-sulfoxide reductase with GAF domain
MSATELASWRAVAGRIMAAADLETALTSVTHEALSALEADIAGVFLREGDRIVMRGCVGNRHRDTARLRMARNEGLAGLVFASGEAARVDTYVLSETISPHFHDLARAEDVKSALGAPLLLGGEVIGVLEVWRRRESVFTPAETERLVALGELGAIALNNARLRDELAESVRQVELAHRQMEQQLHRVEHALATQQELLASILDGGGLVGTLRIAAQRCDGAAIHLDIDLEPVAAYPLDTDVGAVAEAVAAKVGRRTRQPGPVWTAVGNRAAVVRAVSAGSDHLGWVVLLSAAPAGDEEVELAVTQASLAVSLNNLEEQAAARARATALEELLLGLLEGSPEDRRAAASRARQLQVDLRGEMRVLVGRLVGLADVADAEGWDAARISDARRRLLGATRTALGSRAVLVALRGDDTVVALVRAASIESTRETLTALSAELVGDVPGMRPAWGVSAVHVGPAELAMAREQAETAARALRHAVDRSVSCYEDLGILRLMLADPRSTDLSRFVTETVGPVIAYDAAHGTELLKTLRTYVDCGCSQQDTAVKLFLHAKTIKYRLVQIEKLTGLDLTDHHARMQVDIAVRAAELFGT